MEALVANEVTKQYAEHTALDKVSISIPQQTIFGLLGPNGAGKTTLIRIINQIINSDSGEITIFGEKLKPSHVEMIGYLPEERGLYKKMKVGDQLLYLAQLKGLSRKDALARIKIWLEKFEIKDWWHKKVEDLSKGMAQKVQFISTVLHEPKLIILDEPFSGFDPVNAELITEKILELKANGSTIIFSTHRMETVESLCDHIALINKSKKILEGPKKQVKDQFRTNTFLVEHRGNHFTLPSEKYELKKQGVIEDGLFSSSIQAKEGIKGNQLIRDLIDITEVYSFQEKLPSMADIFISLVKGEGDDQLKKHLREAQVYPQKIKYPESSTHLLNKTMNKVWLIIQREFLTRVKKKSFLIVTIVVPLIIPAIIGGLVAIMMKEVESAKPDTVMVVDTSGQFNLDSTKNTKRFLFVPLQMQLDQAMKVYNETQDFALLYIPPFDINKPEGLTIYTQEKPSIEKIGDIESILEEKVRDLKLREFKIDKEVLKNLKTDISLNQANSKTGKSSNAGILYVLGFILGIMIYVFVLIYGIQIMQGVIDEKTSKVVEVIVSSVKPFQLMLGKIVGIAAVGVLQFIIWIVLITFLSSGVLGYFGLKMPQKQAMEQVTKKMQQNEDMKQAMEQQNNKVNEILGNLGEIPFMKIAFVFVFYFIGGYLLYGALFAAVGSAVDSMQESQQFQFPITMPLLIGYLGLFMFILRDPHGPVSFWLSIIPFTSPVAMVGRIAFDVPAWELILSMVLLVGGFIFTTWIAGRIYRVGILMTGAKVNWKVMVKWFMMRE